MSASVIDGIQGVYYFRIAALLRNGFEIVQKSLRNGIGIALEQILKCGGPADGG